ncbi:uncharacterized protein LOC144994414 [Oryzias latipes]
MQATVSPENFCKGKVALRGLIVKNSLNKELAQVHRDGRQDGFTGVIFLKKLEQDTFRMAPRISPQKDAMHHVITKTDKTGKLEVKFINAVKGRGVFATHSFNKGDFIVEYRALMPLEKMALLDEGEEITYDYGGNDCPWRTKSPTDGLHMDAVEQGNPVTLPEIQTDDASGLCSSFLQSPTDGLHMDAVEQGNPVTLPEIQTDDASGLCSSFLQSPTDGLHMDAVEQGNPVTLPEIQTDDASGLCSSFLQSPTDGLHMDAVEQGNPVTLPEIQTDDASGLCSSFLQVQLCLCLDCNLRVP